MSSSKRSAAAVQGEERGNFSIERACWSASRGVEPGECAGSGAGKGGWLIKFTWNKDEVEKAIMKELGHHYWVPRFSLQVEVEGAASIAQVMQFKLEQLNFYLDERLIDAKVGNIESWKKSSGGSNKWESGDIVYNVSPVHFSKIPNWKDIILYVPDILNVTGLTIKIYHDTMVQGVSVQNTETGKWETRGDWYERNNGELYREFVISDLDTDAAKVQGGGGSRYRSSKDRRLKKKKRSKKKRSKKKRSKKKRSKKRNRRRKNTKRK